MLRTDMGTGDPVRAHPDLRLPQGHQVAAPLLAGHVAVALHFAVGNGCAAATGWLPG